LTVMMCGCTLPRPTEMGSAKECADREAMLGLR
jgi:hypothetical protein